MGARRAALGLVLVATACGSGAERGAGNGAVAAGAASPASTASLAALQDPETCRPCHAEHYREWESSMHAYAAKDPLFIAMNERGQRETGGALGEFCVRCHAPMALELGLTSDGLNLPDLDDPNARGVTCYFCHNIDSVARDHNRGVTLAHDSTMRAALGPQAGASDRHDAAPVQPNPVHQSAYSALHDARDRRSAALCGACHDIVNDRGVALERTYAQWRSSRFSREGAELKTCSGCHMPEYAGRAAPDAPQRTLHRHLWPGVDTALTAGYPGVAAQTAAIDCAFEGAIELDLEPDNDTFDAFDVTLRNRGVGHAWPSGAAQDRRAWVEFTAYDAQGSVIFHSGQVQPGAVVGQDEPGLELLHDQLFDASARPVHMFWQAAASPEHPLGYESNLLPAAGDGDAVHVVHYALPAPASRVTASLRLQAVGLDVIDDFQGIALPITERVLAARYAQQDSLRSRIRTIRVPGTQRELTLRAGQLLASEPAAPDPACAAQAYVSLLPDEP